MDTLFDCLKRGTAPERVVAFAREYLAGEGFEELYYDRLFAPKLGGRYFITPFPDNITRNMGNGNSQVIPKTSPGAVIVELFSSFEKIDHYILAQCFQFRSGKM